MNVAQPCRSASIGRITSPHTDGRMSAYSSSTTPSRYGPRSRFGLSAPWMRMRAPLISSTQSSLSLLVRIDGPA